MQGEYHNVVGVTDNNGSISVFNIDPMTGGLSLVDQDDGQSGIQVRDSGGVRPMSTTFCVRNGLTWVLVGNQYSSPHYRDSPASTEIFDALGNNAIIDNIASNGRNMVAFTLRGGF